MTNQELNTHAVKVIGHRNPDTDSICSAIAYSRLKNILDPEHPCKPCRAGLLNRETENGKKIRIRFISRSAFSRVV